jgi:hypothetical protein
MTKMEQAWKILSSDLTRKKEAGKLEIATPEYEKEFELLRKQRESRDEN